MFFAKLKVECFSYDWSYLRGLESEREQKKNVLDADGGIKLKKGGRTVVYLIR